MKTPVTISTIRKHLLYHSWMYILLVVLSIFGWNLIFTMTAYRPPQEKIIDIYAFGLTDVEGLDAYWQELNKTEFPDMEQMTATTLMNDETYGTMVLMTRVAAGEGDIYFLPKDQFASYAAQGALSPLEGNAELMAVVEEAGINLERGVYREEESGQRHTYGIPLSQLPSLQAYMLMPTSDYFVCVLTNNQNEENVMKALTCLVRDMSKPLPEPEQ